MNVELLPYTTPMYQILIFVEFRYPSRNYVNEIVQTLLPKLDVLVNVMSETAFTRREYGESNLYPVYSLMALKKKNLGKKKCYQNPS